MHFTIQSQHYNIVREHTINCTVHLPILEVGPSKVCSPVFSPLNYNDEHAQPNTILFTIYFSIILKSLDIHV